MTVKQLENVIKSGAGLEIKPGKRYLIFVDPRTIDIRAFEGPFCLDADIQIIALLPVVTGSMSDCVAGYELLPSEEGKS